jgi:hypothetical protein
MRARRAAAWIGALALGVGLTATCSLSNKEGPNVTCADLQCGRVNACSEGIIASCSDGVTVKWHVCTDVAEDICGKEWQTPQQFKCDEFDIECEGCRPERTDGCAVLDQGAGGAGGAGGT